jgi:hypothetical protein
MYIIKVRMFDKGIRIVVPHSLTHGLSKKYLTTRYRIFEAIIVIRLLFCKIMPYAFSPINGQEPVENSR